MNHNVSCCLPQDAPFKTYDDVIRHLDGLGVFHMDMGLGRMERALSALGLDRPLRPTVQVVGTNGKGSTSSFLQAIAMAHSLKAGLYTSPHFVVPEERIRVGHAMLPPARWPALASRAVQAEAGLTYFELLTVMAAEAFALSDCDLIIYEAGLGGRYDATSALPAHMTCFVPIDLDHVEILGRTIAAIAEDKADAMQNGRVLAVSAPQPEEARLALEKRADELGIPLCSCPSADSCEGTEAGLALWTSLPAELRELAVLPEGAKLGLHGPHQRMNAQTALLAWVLLCHRFGWKTNRQSILEGLERAFIPGRLQYAPAAGSRPALWLDGAHNQHGMAALVSALGDKEAVPGALRPGAVVFSCLRDKAPEKLAAMLREAVGGVPVFVPEIKDNPRAATKEELCALLGEQARPAESLDAAISSAAEAAAGTPVLICGSLYLLGDVFSRFPELLAPQNS
ncbi:MAG: bifunctional folylpolyglutamate synthase/dihydrofolate synthase [Mailhella sp.]|nr:bifunctional folylpolyglutamate synthase/dihydrofolate synthase [Mailhella sp.]